LSVPTFTLCHNKDNKSSNNRLQYKQSYSNQLSKPLLNKFHKPELSSSTLLLLNKPTSKENQELNISHMKHPMLIIKPYKKLKPFHTKRDSPTIMPLNTKPNISHTHILINMLIIFHKKEYTMNKLLKKDNNKELNIKLSKNRLSTKDKLKLAHKLQDHKIPLPLKLLDNLESTTYLNHNYQHNKYNKYMLHKPLFQPYNNQLLSPLHNNLSNQHKSSNNHS